MASPKLDEPCEERSEVAADATQPSPPKVFKRYVRPVLMVITFGFVAYAAWDVARRWGTTELVLDPVEATLAMIALLAGFFAQALAWVLLIERMAGKRVPRFRAISLYMDSQLARYTPGKVGLPIVRMHGAPMIEVPPHTVGSSVAVEMLCWTAVGSALSFFMIFVSGREGLAALGEAAEWALPLFVASVLGVVALLAVDRRHMPSAPLRWLKLEGKGPLVPGRVPLVQLSFWASWAVHGFFLTRAVGADAAAAASASAFFVLAPVAGFVALVAPAGAGVRDAILYFALAPMVGAAPAATAALVSRAMSLAGDVLAWLIARVIAGARRSPSAEAQPADSD
jgi:hypothetical protein